MHKFKATVYRTYSYEVEFTSEDAPERIDPEGKADWIARDVPMENWDLVDSTVDVYHYENV